MPAPTLLIQTTYAELLDRCASAAFSESFAGDGVFVPKTIKGRRYWYFQPSTEAGRKQKYVGPETPALLKQIESHNNARDDERERRALVSTLVRQFRLPAPTPETGNILAALAKAGVFRLRAVVVGTAAYQTYPAMLGTTLEATAFQTGDIDIAQFQNVSLATKDKTPAMLDVLKEADKTFRAVPTLYKGQTTAYAAKNGFRVEFVTPNQGRETDRPRPLPALQTSAQPLRFMDFLIHEPEHAVVLHDAGVEINVPSPQRYAIHKLIVSQRRRKKTIKRDKDLQQAEALITVMIEKRPNDLKAAWKEAFARGKKWQEALQNGLSNLSVPERERFVKLIGQKFVFE